MAVQVQPDMSLVKLDFGLVEQAITNLLHNASLYTPAGSTIDIRVFVEKRDCVIVMSDNGPGFPKDSLPKVFEKFYRVPGTKTGGTGLGLSIARGFIEAHRGTMKVENGEGGGACFTIRIPIQGENPTTTPEPT